jgi:hypothetical protein
MKKQIVFVLFIVIMFQNLSCYGQILPDSTRTFRIETKDSNIFVGTIIAED